MCVDPDQVWKVAELVTPILSRATRLAAHTIRPVDVFDACERGAMQLWLVAEESGDVLAVCVTELVAYPTDRKACRILLGAGRGMGRWKHHLGSLEDFAKAEGCEIMEIQGRPGWGRVYPEYRELYRTFVKEL